MSEGSVSSPNLTNSASKWETWKETEIILFMYEFQFLSMSQNHLIIYATQ